uniref:CCHC-type domain-containing protein n=1 Tax=Nicotiana tabacum TaxID=4097 RepID=A0A1S4D0G6_TOBAC|nr:PREDICTED: uncharacterized protein LOC107824600 [Nicotiana tabacum]
MSQKMLTGFWISANVCFRQRIEVVCIQECGEKEAKRPRGSGGSGGVPSGGKSYRIRGHHYRHAQTGRPCPASQSTPRAPLVQGSFVQGSSGSYSGSRGPPQNSSPFFERDCYECEKLGHVRKYCPRLSRGPVQ